MVTAAPLRLGLVGLHNHYHALPMAAACRDGLVSATIAAIYDPRAELAQRVAAEYRIPVVADERDAILTDPDIDAVIVMSDTAAHTDDILTAFAHGKPVLVDKPLAVTTLDARHIVEAASAAGLPLGVAFHIRFAPPYVRARHLIESGVIGAPLSMRIAIRVPLEYVTGQPGATDPGWYADPARAGGGGFLDHAVHYADAMRYLLATEAAQVTGVIGNLAHPELGVDDYGVALITTTAGQVVTVESSWHAPGWYSPDSSAEECVIVGTDGELVLRYHGEPQLEYSAHGIDGRVRETWTGDDRGPVAYVRMLGEFVDVIRCGGVLSATGVDGLEATRIVDAAYESSRTRASISLQPGGTD